MLSDRSSKKITAILKGFDFALFKGLFETILEQNFQQNADKMFSKNLREEPHFVFWNFNTDFTKFD